MKAYVKALGLNLFDPLVTTARADSSNENEGVTISSSIVTGIYENTWLLPGQTFNDSYVMDNGTMYVKVLGQFLADTTALCADSNADGYQGTRQVPVSIDTKTSTWINGCYASKGIVNRAEHNMLKKEAGKALAEAWQNQIETMITAEGQAFPYTATELADKPRTVIHRAKKGYKQVNKVDPTTAIINYDYEFDLIESFSNGATFTPAKNEQALVNGQLGTMFGMLLIPADIGEIFYIYNWETLHVPIAKNAINNTLSGNNGNFGTTGISDNPMLQIMEEANARAGTGITWIHMNYGKKIVTPRQFYVATLTVTP